MQIFRYIDAILFLFNLAIHRAALLFHFENAVTITVINPRIPSKPQVSNRRSSELCYLATAERQNKYSEVNPMKKEASKIVAIHINMYVSNLITHRVTKKM